MLTNAQIKRAIILADIDGDTKLKLSLESLLSEQEGEKQEIEEIEKLGKIGEISKGREHWWIVDALNNIIDKQGEIIEAVNKLTSKEE